MTSAGDLIAGPYHPAFGHLVYGEIVLDAISVALERMETRSDPLTITVQPIMVSRVQGLNKRNIKHLHSAFELGKIRLVQDGSIEKNHLMIATQHVSLP